MLFKKHNNFMEKNLGQELLKSKSLLLKFNKMRPLFLKLRELKFSD